MGMDGSQAIPLWIFAQLRSSGELDGDHRPENTVDEWRWPAILNIKGVWNSGLVAPAGTQLGHDPGVDRRGQRDPGDLASKRLSVIPALSARQGREPPSVDPDDLGGRFFLGA
jgi:hypothetical protein